MSLGNFRYRVIGVITEFVPFVEHWVNLEHRYKNKTISNSGYAVAVAMDQVLELINSPQVQKAVPEEKTPPSQKAESGDWGINCILPIFLKAKLRNEADPVS